MSCASWLMSLSWRICISFSHWHTALYCTRILKHLSQRGESLEYLQEKRPKLLPPSPRLIDSERKKQVKIVPTHFRPQTHPLGIKTPPSFQPTPIKKSNFPYISGNSEWSSCHLIYGEIFAHFLIYKEARSHIWLCNCSTLNFLIYEEKLIFFFISAERC